ncbi:hypothetical protein [Alteromonas sp. C1M14]|uniref:hypothetical protein n=1 Tax=Alteromonas sp. C1M14 TaxID=2841567 RepID=UPI001C091C32|nr:hypothetical protein [Alteromonas sp. C1M14]MBU2977175.1 hypothetical protein [Alteromonas sp. C1M14]
MQLFLKSELQHRDKAQEKYIIAQRRSDYALEHVKLKSRLLIARPAALLSIFAAGACKGLTSNQPKSRRKQALFTFARTAFFNFIG